MNKENVETIEKDEVTGAENAPASYTPVKFDPPHIPDQSKLRDYQKECIQAIEDAGPGSHLIVMATGTGKTMCFSHIPRHGRVLILSHRDELVHQPEKNYDCSYGVEQAKESSNGEEVVSASVQSLVRRLHRFKPDEFDMIITDEAHHATAPSYQKIYNYFKPRVHLGFTATPDRNDKNDLNKIYDDIVFFRDIKWGIKEGYLTDVDCIRVDVGFDLRKARKQMGDFNQSDLGNAMDNPEVIEAVAEAYEKYAKGQTLIFAANVSHANKIAKLIKGSMVVTGETPNRDQIIKDFTDRKIPCLINVMVFSEGTDMPLIETVIMARPTANQSLYTQMAGRGLRLYPGKTSLTLVDCVGASRLSLCTAPTLFGLNADVVPKERQDMVQGKLTDMANIINIALDTPKSWIENAQRVSVFGEENDYDFHGVDWKLLPDESLQCSIGDSTTIIVPPANALGKTTPVMVKNSKYGDSVIGTMKEDEIQIALNKIFKYLVAYKDGSRALWDRKFAVNGWGSAKASSKQIDFIKTLMKRCNRKFDKYLNDITKHEASIVIDRLNYEIANGKSGEDPLKELKEKEAEKMMEDAFVPRVSKKKKATKASKPAKAPKA